MIRLQVTQAASMRRRDVVVFGKAIGCSQTQQQPVLARCAARGPGNTGHRTEIAGTTRECRMGIPEKEGKVPTGSSQAPFLVRRQPTNLAEVTGTGMVGKALGTQEVHLPDETPYRRGNGSRYGYQIYPKTRDDRLSLVSPPCECLVTPN